MASKPAACPFNLQRLGDILVPERPDMVFAAITGRTPRPATRHRGLQPRSPGDGLTE
jgi:hypothetical protein